MHRRTLLELLATAGLGASACAVTERKPMPEAAATKTSSATEAATGAVMPALFLAHGAPILMDDPGWVGELATVAAELPRPSSILMLSAHWEKRPATLGATRPVPLYYDFYGFPERYYQVTYAAPGAPELATRVRALLAERKLPVADSDRGLDHGAYVPLLCMYPRADVPVLQLSLPSLEPKELFALGQALAPLRSEGVLVIGSGFLTHNMRFAFRHDTPSWAVEFDAWAKDVLARRDHDALMDFQNRGPAAHVALPTTEHFVPVIVAAGASADRTERIAFPIEGFWGQGGGAFTRRSVRFG
ncbi:MAG TPA: class III extradiol ring-cleavage dioxygenase [Polyangiaceae bacterium]|nr:class III extradiol ring-cleavage dioxygenase [Polyangiaceae bacterium]